MHRWPFCFRHGPIPRGSPAGSVPRDGRLSAARLTRVPAAPGVHGSERASGASVYTGGVYIEVEPKRRIVFTWDTNVAGAEPDLLSVVTVEFAEEPGGVEISITHRKLATAEAIDMDAGWNNTFDSLQQYASAEAARWAVSAPEEEKG